MGRRPETASWTNPAYARTRHDAVERLAALIAAELDAARQVLIGFDFPFGYPAGVAAHLTGQASALALWNWLAVLIEDAVDNTNNRFAVSEEINRAYPGLGPFWGRPQNWPYPEVPTRESSRTGREAHPPERRIADLHAIGTPKLSGNCSTPAPWVRRCCWVFPLLNA